MAKPRTGPADPTVRLARAAEAKLRQRQARMDPGSWGISPANLALAAAAVDLETAVNDNGVLAARRSDPFDLLLKARGLSDEQHKAARRLFRDFCARAGVVEGRDHLNLEPSGPGSARPDPSFRVNDLMLDAGGRVVRALAQAGPVNGRLLNALISPMVDEGRITAWRGVVERVTGEKNKDVQGAMVRQACEALRLVYEAWAQLAA